MCLQGGGSWDRYLVSHTTDLLLVLVRLLFEVGTLEVTGATRGVMVSTSAFLAGHQC